MEKFNNIKEFKSSPKLIEKLNKIGITKSYPAGSIILNENAAISSIPIVMTGVIKVIKTEEDGKEILLYYLNDGESCVMSFLGGLHKETSKIKAVVEEDADILFIPIHNISDYIKEFPQFLEYIFRLYHRRFEELIEMVNDIAFKKVDERLLSLLQKRAEISKSKIIYTTHEQLANELGTARVVISRLLKQLEEENKLSLARNKITLL